VSPLLFICTTTKTSSYKHGCRPRLLYLSRRFPSPSLGLAPPLVYPQIELLGLYLREIRNKNSCSSSRQKKLTRSVASSTVGAGVLSFFAPKTRFIATRYSLTPEGRQNNSSPTRESSSNHEKDITTSLPLCVSLFRCYKQ
jgi:hypothetical protein